MTGLLNPKSSGKNKNNWPFFCVILIAYLGPGSFRPVDVLFSIKSVLGHVLSSQIEEHQKKSGAPLSS